MTPKIIARREGHDAQRTPPGSGDQPDPNEPLDEPKGAEPAPGPEEAWSPARETEPVTKR